MDGLLQQGHELSACYNSYQNDVDTKIANMRSALEAAKTTLQSDPTQLNNAMQSLSNQAKQMQFQRAQKDIQSSIQKFGKDMEKKFKHDISVIYQPESFAGKEQLMQRALAVHFIRQGQFDMCDMFIKEMTSSAGILPDTDDIAINDPALIEAVESLKEQFRQMYKIMKQLSEDHYLEEAIVWAKLHGPDLLGLSSSLEFNLHRLKFVQLLLDKRPMDALVYGRQHFAPFGDKHFAEIKRLMTCTIYSDLAHSPYHYLCTPSLWDDIQIEFQRDFCSLLNMSADSPLYACIYVGTTALPIIMKVHKIMAAKRAEWSQQDELPVEIPLDDDMRFHSVFTCPVSKEQATDTNPPMMMPCGHVICKESLQRLSRNSRYGRNALRFKCPYCPSESTVDQAIQVHF
ncbi:hypothetical protein DM01DRAFT_1227315 [Hesseltinella vesiculosa]|uniref:GID complex catalytic subunit 2 n=1 Tax=Hesseltinella vesiculosa TaxID=101127 RepID=A0A1X2GMX6_9FUNG|nr:hypothetical protein DM01DRAFT_1227315 [Hesseltinella vesiculosa]